MKATPLLINFITTDTICATTSTDKQDSTYAFSLDLMSHPKHHDSFVYCSKFHLRANFMIRQKSPTDGESLSAIQVSQFSCKLTCFSQLLNHTSSFSLSVSIIYIQGIFVFRDIKSQHVSLMAFVISGHCGCITPQLLFDNIFKHCIFCYLQQ